MSLPKTAKVLKTGATLHDPETPVEGVTTLQILPDLKDLGELAVRETDTPVCPPPTGGKAAKKSPQTRVSVSPPPDLVIAARWGYAGQGGVTMPAPGKVTSGTEATASSASTSLNATTRWKDVPEAVWNYTLSGYQALKKWLSYRESALLARPLTSDEAHHFTTTSAASPASSLCMRSWMRTTGRVFESNSSNTLCNEPHENSLDDPLGWPWCPPGTV